MNQENQFMVKSENPPKVELSDAGVYVRFKDDAAIARPIQYRHPQFRPPYSTNQVAHRTADGGPQKVLALFVTRIDLIFAI